MNIREQYQLLAEHGAMFLLSMYLIATMPAPLLATVGITFTDRQHERAYHDAASANTPAFQVYAWKVKD
jgi:hypothetical protein